MCFVFNMVPDEDGDLQNNIKAKNQITEAHCQNAFKYAKAVLKTTFSYELSRKYINLYRNKNKLLVTQEVADNFNFACYIEHECVSRAASFVALCLFWRPVIFDILCYTVSSCTDWQIKCTTMMMMMNTVVSYW